MKSVEEQLALIKRGAEELLVEAELIEKLKRGQPLRIKAGFDPTAPDLHLGHTVLINKLRQFQELGHQVIFLIGDFTGMIGDPSGKSEERKLLDVETLERNVAGLRAQLRRFLDFDKGGAILVNNYDWFKGFSYLEFLRKVGKQFSVNAMLTKESVRARLEDREQGISYTEFSYMLIQ
ncbi:MAG: tyrosyl-tRNA synthetase, partial [Pseudomonas sp.]|nr:tyrosyl-tRNA synthetase [Pseudomonas sp.]